MSEPVKAATRLLNCWHIIQRIYSNLGEEDVASCSLASPEFRQAVKPWLCTITFTEAMELLALDSTPSSRYALGQVGSITDVPVAGTTCLSRFRRLKQVTTQAGPGREDRIRVYMPKQPRVGFITVCLPNYITAANSVLPRWEVMDDLPAKRYREIDYLTLSRAGSSTLANLCTREEFQHLRMLKLRDHCDLPFSRIPTLFDWVSMGGRLEYLDISLNTDKDVLESLGRLASRSPQLSSIRLMCNLIPKLGLYTVVQPFLGSNLSSLTIDCYTCSFSFRDMPSRPSGLALRTPLFPWLLELSLDGLGNLRVVQLAKVVDFILLVAPRTCQVKLSFRPPEADPREEEVARMRNDAYEEAFRGFSWEKIDSQ